MSQGGADFITGGIPLSDADDNGWVEQFFWITYRYDMPTLPGTAFTSDTGWGCMIRCGQMLCASALAATLLGEDWLRHPMDPVVRKYIVGMFLDDPEAPLAIHRIAAAGEQLGRRFGEWHAPSITCRCISEIINTRLPIGLKSYAAVDMTIDMGAVGGLFEGNKVLLWIPMRLGLDRVSADYVQPLLHLLSTRHCLGMAGGKPNSALYFVGFREGQLLYLDPHHTRPAIKSAELTEEDVQTYKCASLGQVALGSIDPCFVVGFLLPDREALQDWRGEMEKIVTDDGVPLMSFTTSGGSHYEATSHTVNIDDDIVAIEFD